MQSLFSFGNQARWVTLLQRSVYHLAVWCTRVRVCVFVCIIHLNAYLWAIIFRASLYPSHSIFQWTRASVELRGHESGPLQRKPVSPLCSVKTLPPCCVNDNSHTLWGFPCKGMLGWRRLEDWIQEGSKVLQWLLANQHSQRGFLHGLWEEEGCTRLTCQVAWAKHARGNPNTLISHRHTPPHLSPKE